MPLTVMAPGLVLLGVGAWTAQHVWPDASTLAVVAVVTVAAMGGAAVAFGKVIAEEHRTEGARQALHEAEERARDSLELRALWDVTNKRLELYHRIATSQARTSFYSAQAAMTIGFASLIVFAVLTANAHTAAHSIVTGALGAGSAAFAGYISRTFVRSQEASAAHLRAYFAQPMQLFRYLAAERLLEGMDPAQRATVAADLARAIVATDQAHPFTQPAAAAPGETAPTPTARPAGAGSPPPTRDPQPGPGSEPRRPAG
jgi:hypothetical protein